MSNEIDHDLLRRRLLQTGVYAGLAAAMSGRLTAAEAGGPLLQKSIPSTGQKIPVIGIGTNEFGSVAYGTNERGGMEDAAARDVLQRMYELGGTVIDTASAYGESEVQVGKALEALGLTQKMFMATKFDAPGQGTLQDDIRGQASIERSFERLHKIDLMFIHLLGGAAAMIPLLLDLKKQGRVKYIGLTNVFRNQDHPKLVEFMRKYPLDFVQVPYSIEDRLIEKEILPLARERRMAVMAVVPFSSNRDNLLIKVGKRPLPDWAADYGIASWGQFLLKYVVSHPDITCVASGTTKVSHVVDNQAAGRGALPNADIRRKMEAYWAAKA